jgi:dephospho-CoA kinase
MERVQVLGIVGGIGSGKSTIGASFAARGAVVLDADAAAHAALEDPRVRAEIVARFGSVGSTTGPIDRAALARRVFADPSELSALERIVHPFVLDDLARRLAQAKSDPSIPLVVLDVPLLLETGLDRECDALAFVDTPRAIRLSRVAATRGWDERELDAREARQRSVADKRVAARYVIDNSGPHADTERAIEAIFAAMSRPTPTSNDPGGPALNRP